MKTISKRFLKGGLALLLAFVMLFGTTLTGFAAVVDNAETSANVDVADTKANVDVAETAATITSDGTARLYFNMSAVSWWVASNGNNNFAYFFNGSTNVWSAHSVNYSGNTYYVVIPAGSWTTVILTRNNTSTAPSWDNKWNQTGNIALSSSSNYISKFSADSTSATWGTAVKPASTAKLTASSTSVNVGDAVTLTPSLSSNANINTIKSTSYSISPSTGASISGNTFTATAAGTYTVTATVTYHPNGYSSLTSTATATTTITVSAPKHTVKFVDYNGKEIYTQEVEEGKTPTAPANPTRTGYTFTGWTPTVGAITGATTYTATYTQNTYALTINESVAGGKFTVDGATFTSGNNVTHGTHTLGVTAPDGYKVTSINGGTANPATINVTGATTVEVVYELEGSCAPHFADTSKMNLVLGEEKTRTASLNQFSTADCGVTYSSSDKTVATVDATTGKVTALKAGTTTITATCSNHSSTAEYQVEVLAPTFSVANVSVDVNGTVTAVPKITANVPAGTYSFKYTSHASNNSSHYYAVTEDGKFTGLKPGSAIANAELVYGGESVAFAPSFNVTVNEFDVSINKSTAKILTGQTVQLSVTSDVTPESISWSKDTVVTVDNNGLVSTTADTGTGHVTATVNYNEFYSKDLTCAVTVDSPTLTVSPETLNLEIGEGSTATTGEITVTNNDTAGADGTDAVAPVLAVTSSKPEVATATIVDGKINVTAKAVGTTTLTVSYRNVEKKVTVNVSQYDPYVYLYVTNNHNFSKLCIYSWVEGGSNITPLGTNMIYIGENGDGHKIFAYRFLKTNKPNRFIITKDNTWNWQTANITVSWTTTDHKAFYFQSANSKTSMGDWTSDCMIVRPTVSVKDLTVVMGETGTAEATVANGDKVVWSIADTAFATVANVETKTATVTSVAPGTTEISARAFVDTANSSIKTLPTNYKTDTACWPYISTLATATVTVDPGSARQITVAPSFSNDGETYEADVTGGTVNATYDTQSGTSIEVPYNEQYTITATPAEGYAFNGWTKNNKDIEGGATLTVAAKDDANYVAKFVKTYTVTVATPDGIDFIKINNTPGITYTAKAGETITVDGSPDGQYLSNATIDPATGFEIVDGKIEFTVTDTDVTIVPVFANYSYVEISDPTGGVTATGLKTGYKAGEEVNITLSPVNAASTLTGVTAEPADNVVITKNGDSYIVTIASMPADTTITLTPTVDAKFVMNYDMKAIGNYGTSFTSYGTVSMKIGETTLAEDGYAAPTDTVTYTATPNTNFIFDGWYSDSECSLSKLLSRNTSYDVKPTADTTIYALFVPKHYMAYNAAATGTYVTMEYVPADRAFVHESSSISKTASFRVTNDKNGWNDSKSYSQFGAEFAVHFNGNGYNLNIGWGNKCYKITDGSDKDYPFTIVVTLDGNESIDVSAKTVKTGNTVLLSSGRNNIGYATTTVLTDGITGESKSVGRDGDKENYLKIKNLPIEGQTLTWETTIGGTNASGLYIESYIAYSMDTGLWEVIEPVSLGNNKYQGTALINSDTYIAPVFFHTEEYNEANGLAAIELYFDASAIKNFKWGPFVSCYSWSANEKVEYFGSWPGQLMIPTPDGKSYYTQLDVPASGSANPAAGVTFNNYMHGTCPVQEGGLFGVTTENIQTYDYREAITLYESNYDVITFVAKTSYDGYHGDKPNGVTPNPVSDKTTAAQLFEKFKFDYLYRRDGVTPMNFNGDEVVNPKAVDAADYYIVSKGDRNIVAGGYSADTNYNGNWSVEWYIFDNEGNYKTKVLSTALWHDTNTTDDDRQTVLLDALGLTPEEAADKTVAISYELANHADGGAHKLAYDGQWYGNYLDDTVNAQVKVGLEETDGVYVIDDDETPNIADYGEAYIDDLNGNNVQSLDIKIDYGIVHTTSQANGNYRFVGWFTKDAAGEFIPYKNTPAFKEYINMDETYYAIFKPIGDEEIVINHIRYENTDPIIPSHGGVGELSIKVTDVETGVVVATGPVNTALSTAIFTATELKTYKIEIITTPLMNGEFFAWYTDSYNVDGTKTYEEVMTYDEAIGSTSQVIGQFEYKYDSEDQSQLKVINIYSDIRKVSNEAVLKYRYINRYGQQKTYTVSGIVLTDDECKGFEGNDFKEYVPAFRTYCKFETPEGNISNIYIPAERIEEYINKGYKLLDSENKIQYYAPKADVTEVYNGTVEWIIADTYLTPQKSEVVLIAKQDEPLYEVKYYMAGNSYSKQGYYNDLLAIQAPLQYDGKDFSYWYDNTNNEILTYTNHYNYRIIENRDIKAVYGATDLAEWTPTIEYVTPTREFSDNSDYIYTDYHLAYTSRDGKILNDVKGTENIQYGLLLARDADYYFGGEGTPNYLQLADIEDDLKQVITDGKSKALNGNNIYFYDLTDLDLTNFNRCDYFLKYDNNKVIGGSHYYREYAFTAVAYMVVDGVIYLSNPDFVNFHELGSMDYDNINNN